MLQGHAGGALLDHGGELLAGHAGGGIAVQTAPGEIVACLLVVGAARHQGVDGVGAAEVDVVDVIVGQMHLLAGDDGDIADTAVALDGLQGGVVAVVIRDDHEIVAVAAVVGDHVDGIVVAVGAAGVDVEVTTLGDTARHVLGQAVDGKGSQAAVAVVDIEVVLALALEVGGDTEATVLVGGHRQGGAAAPLGPGAHIALIDLQDLHGVGLILGKGGADAQGLDGNGLLAVAQEYLGVYVVIVVNLLHSVLLAGGMVIPISYYILRKKSRGWGKFGEKNLREFR